MKIRPIVKAQQKLAWVEVFCPGCEKIHSIPIGPNNNPRWKLNELPGQTKKTNPIDDMEKPTLDLSILYHQSDTQPRCHSWIRLGKWYFLEDCDHKYAGKIIPMIDLPT